MLCPKRQASHCWHAFSGEERSPGDYPLYRRCCWCGELQESTRTSKDNGHGPHEPTPLLVVERWERVDI